MDGLQSVPHIGQRARDDHAHRVIEIRTLHLIGDQNRTDLTRTMIAAIAFGIACQNQTLGFLERSILKPYEPCELCI